MKFFGLFKKEKRSIDANVTVGTNNNEQNASGTSASVSNAIKVACSGDGLTLSPLFAAVNIISNSCAILPWKFVDENGEHLRSSHYLYHLFDNTIVDKYMSVKNAIRDVLLAGNGFLHIERDFYTGRPISLRYLPQSSVSIMVNATKTSMYYYCSLIQNKYIPMSDMIHFKMHSNDGLVGIGLPWFARQTIVTAQYTEDAQTEYVQSGGAVHGILTPNNTNPSVPTLKKQVEEIRKSWEEARVQHGTTTIILPADMKFTQLSTNARDAALIDTRLYNLQEVARYFNISPILLGDLSHTQYGSIAESQKEFVNHTLQPYVVMIELELNKKLIMPTKIGKEIIDLDENAILAIDKEKQGNYLTNLVTKGIITQNEARMELGLPAVEGGDQLIVAYSKVDDNSTTANNSKVDDNSTNANNSKVEYNSTNNQSEEDKNNEDAKDE